MRAVDFYTTKTGVKSHFLIFHIIFLKNNDVKNKVLMFCTMFTRAILKNSLKYIMLETHLLDAKRFMAEYSIIGIDLK